VNKQTVVKEYSFPLGGIVFVILFVLKLLGEIDMSWFWVLTSWIWVPVLVLLSAMALIFVFGAVMVLIAAIFSR